MDDFIHYIKDNYMDYIKLETIAPLFGYNSSYLGKIFNKKLAWSLICLSTWSALTSQKSCWRRQI